MQKSAKLNDAAQKSAGSRRKGKLARMTAIDVQKVQDYIDKQILQASQQKHINSLLPSVESMVGQMQRIMSIEFPGLDLKTIFVQTGVKNDNLAEFQRA